MVKQMLAAGIIFGVTLNTASLSYSHYRGNTLDPINKGPLNVLRREQAQCGEGWTFPGLVWGDRPLSVCMYKTKKKNVFGGEF